LEKFYKTIIKKNNMKIGYILAIGAVVVIAVGAYAYMANNQKVVMEKEAMMQKEAMMKAEADQKIQEEASRQMMMQQQDSMIKADVMIKK